ncbi:hypothetical protein [Herbaspirillum frisingense]|uniref:hypothetical protein n=1 Tax=Herbaspirillum frisingense TaxID=92645 RepID=UPI0039AFDC2B
MPHLFDSIDEVPELATGWAIIKSANMAIRGIPPKSETGLGRMVSSLRPLPKMEDDRDSDDFF